jgi:hypothetical protein
MHNRWFSATVVILWLATMSWLVKAKVLPLMLVGEPPSLPSIVESQADAPPVGWSVSFRDKQLGWALTATQRLPSGLCEIRGRVRFDALPLDEMLSGPLKQLAGLFGHNGGSLRVDAGNLVIVDPLGHLLRFESTAWFAPPGQSVRVRGAVEGRNMELLVNIAGTTITNTVPFNSNSMPIDVLSPQSQLPGLHAGQNWSVPIYNPLWPGKNPLEILQATVECQEPIFWNGAVENAWLVVYRNAADSADKPPRGRLWVRRDGAVLKQEANLLDSPLVFIRLSDKEASLRAGAAGQSWWMPQQPPTDGQP